MKCKEVYRMYTVYIYKNKSNNVNRLIHLLTNAKEMISENDTTKINKDVIENIFKLCFNETVSNYEVKIEIANEIGQFIVIENDEERKYIQFSCDNETRNGYVLTKMVLALRTFIEDASTKTKTFNVLLLDVDEDVYNDHNINARKNETKGVYSFDELNTDNLQSSQIVTPYNTFAYRLLKTCDFTLINEKLLPYKKYIKDTAPKKSKDKKTKTHKEYIDNEQLVKKPFKSIEEFERARNQISSDNKGNKSSYFVVGQKSIVVYAKTFGNNEYEMIPIIYCLHVLANKDGKDLILYQIKDGEDPKAIGSKNMTFIKKLGVTVYSDLEEYVENPNALIEEKEDSRDQVTFKKNLMLKYGHQKCYLCGCDIQENIIASHIQRVCDINHLPLPYKERRNRAIDGNNGFWLCANHDKMFEFGIITFNEMTGEFVLGQDYLEGRELTPAQIAFIEDITKGDKIQAEHFTEKMAEYLKFHNDRIRNENLKSILPAKQSKMSQDESFNLITTDIVGAITQLHPNEFADAISNTVREKSSIEIDIKHYQCVVSWVADIKALIMPVATSIAAILIADPQLLNAINVLQTTIAVVPQKCKEDKNDDQAMCNCHAAADRVRARLARSISMQHNSQSYGDA